MDAPGRSPARRSRRPTPSRTRSASSPRRRSGRSCRCTSRCSPNGKVAAWDGFEAAVNSEHTWDPWTRPVRRHPDRPQPVLRRPHHAHRRAPARRRRPHPGLRGHQGHEPVRRRRRNTWQRGAGHGRGALVPDRDDAARRPRVRRLRRRRSRSARPDPSTPVPLTIASNTLPEIYNPATDTWTSLPAAARRMPLYPFMFVLPNGKLFDAGPDTTTRTLNLSTGQWTTVGHEPDRRPERGHVPAGQDPQVRHLVRPRVPGPRGDQPRRRRST